MSFNPNLDIVSAISSKNLLRIKVYISPSFFIWVTILKLVVKTYYNRFFYVSSENISKTVMIFLNSFNI